MTGDTTVSTGDIARLGGVGRAAVSNWRRRHDDFPAPVGGTASSPRFALGEVEAWLRRNGKPYRLSAADRAWQRLRSGGTDLLVPARLAAASAALLARHDPALVDLLPGDDAPTGTDAELEALLADLAETRGPAAAVEELCARHRRRPGEPTDALATAMARIAAPDGGSVLDPACGTGSLLLACAPGTGSGQESDVDAARIAAVRLLFAGPAGAEAPVVAGDALRSDGFAGREFDAVLCAPPAGDRAWGHAELAADPRFVHGLPPRGEPELAWVQHGLAHVRPGGLVVLRLPAAVAGRRPGRRIRANLLRAGALRAVLTVEDGAGGAHGDLWVLRRPEPGDPPPSAVLLGRAGVESVAELWESFLAGAERPRPARAVPVVDLLDDDVDVSPERHLPRRGGSDPGRTFDALRRAAPDGVPALRVVRDPRDRPAATVAELARAAVLSVRHAPRSLPAEGDLPVLTVADLATGTTPTGRTGSGARLVRVRPGDVVGSPMGRARVADASAVLGPGLTVYRTDPEQLDPEFLAGVLRSAPMLAGGASSRYGHRVRVPLLPITEQRAHGVAFRALLDAADAARAAAERAESLLRLGGEGLVEGWLQPE
ncbi:N-6 DNA methylase [Pseudonocardia nigra]|uniref:N-6 DNA methylase n=1 Tax=Pseudonocardia nigra TaxID=1921578 RepID=UPI001C5DC283|nr:N-6 DNA methylase [Pseudonocardia nigra]